VIRAPFAIVRRALSGLAHRPSRVALAVGAIAVALMLLGTVRLASRNVDSSTAHWRSGVQMIVYLEDGTDGARARQIQSALEQLDAVASTEYVAKEQALDRLRASLGEHDELASGVEPAMLPASIEVSLVAGVKDVAAAHPVIKRLENVRGVEEVEFLGEWVDRMTALTGALRYAAWFITMLVGLACCYIVFATLRLSMARRRREVETLELLGATRRYVRAPMILEGALQGAAGALVAVGMLWILFRFTAGEVSTTLDQVFGGVEIIFLPASDVALVVGVGAAFGVLGSWLATGQRALARA
jgi:cell division transport system permease protein